MRKTLLVLIGLSVFVTSCTKDPIITDPTPGTGENKPNPKPEEPDGENGSSGNYIIPATYQQYYSKVNFTKSGMQLKEQLAKLVKDTHLPQSYTPGIWNASEFTDEDPNNTNNVIQIYSWPDKDVQNIKDPKDKIAKTRSVNKEHKNNGTSSLPVTSLWEREHVFAKALAVDKTKNQKALETGRSEEVPTAIEYIAGHDAHHLRSINRSTNSSRSNRKFVNDTGNSKTIGKEYYYPGDEWRGDVARMMMYMHIRYENENGGGYTKASKVGMPIDTKGGILSDEMIDLFLKWNAEDPVSEIERRRNEYHGNPYNPVYKNSQGNRNPFIDNPRLATQIWGGPEAQNLWTK